MKKILSMMAIAAMVCGAFTACDNEDENENNPVTPEPQAIEATATATSITVTVNPELLKGGAPNGYVVSALGKEFADGFSEEGEQSLETTFYNFTFYLDPAEENTVTITETAEFFGYAPEAIQPGTEYYVFVGVYNEDSDFNEDGSDFSYITITTPAE